MVFTIVYGLAVAAVTAWLSAQVIVQTFWPDAEDTELSCRAGIHHLLSVVDHARNSATGPGDEQAVLARFRDAMAEQWPILPTLRRKCAGDREATRALGLVERLRYAEEQSLRHYSSSVGPLREKVQRLTGQLSGGG